MDSNTADLAWSRPPDQVDTLAQMNALDELGEFFEFTDLDLNGLSAVSAAPFGDPIQAHGSHPNTPFEEMNEMQALAAASANNHIGQDQFSQHQHNFNGVVPTSNPFGSEDFYQPNLQQSFVTNNQFQFQTPQTFPTNQHVPPTPNSFEMHGEAGQFLQQMNRQMDAQHRAVLEQRYQLRKDDIAFTPMVSPAGTPSQFAVADYTINPGAYFSPLTSPALHAQNSAQFSHAYHTSAHTTTSSAAASPNGDVDMLSDDVLLPEAATAKKPRVKRSNTPRTADPLARVRQSPIQKATKRKSGSMLTSFATPGDVDTVRQSPLGPSSQPGSAGLAIPAHFRNDSSESGSISPEPLSEALMGPPPRPTSSVTASPVVTAQHGEVTPTATGKAATPKTFLAMQRSNGSGAGASSTAGGDEQLADLELPGAAAAADAEIRPALPQLNTKVIPAESQNTPRLAARKTPKLGPTSTPSSTRPGSVTASPSIMGSPMTASTPGALLKDRKLESKSRTSKKRGSVGGSSSALVSPALRPKISPSIKPLLPEGSTLHSPTHALLLASKSNYQNLLEGNTLPGVNYPDSLSTGLTSKRTSHKVAEQGRRNRINEALKEMQALLPKVAKPAKDAAGAATSDGASPDENGDGKDSKDDAGGKSNSSKAATVESANEYIRQLQKENAQVASLKQQLEEMKRQLAQMSAGGSEDAMLEDGKANGVESVLVAADEKS